jgi:pimeloyl-ACP methyl ester carboxylesterase
MSLFRQDGTAEDALLADDQALFRSILTESGLAGPHLDTYARYATDRALLTGGLNWYRAMTLLDLDGLGPITCPVTYVWGDQDRFFGGFAVERCAEHMAGAYHLEVLRGVNHWIPELEPEMLARLVVDRVASLQH